MGKMTFTAGGDLMIKMRMPGEYEGFQEIAGELKKGEMVLFNLEGNVHDYEHFCSAYCGKEGGYMRVEPATLADIKKFGFNVACLANNHSFDYGYNGIETTLKHVKASGIVPVGSGMNMFEASAPAYLDCPDGRVGVVAMTASYNPAAMAGTQAPGFRGRPGVNGVRHNQILYVTQEQMGTLKEIAAVTGVNGQSGMNRKNGFMLLMPENRFDFGGLIFEVSDKPGKTTTVNETDMDRIERAIREAKFQADFVVVAMHNHEIRHTEKTEPPEFLEAFSRACIDLGADAVIGSGTHWLMPIEVYKNRPIFYSLGTFCMQYDTSQRLPPDLLEYHKMPVDTPMYEYYRRFTRNFTVGQCHMPECWETVIPYWEMEDGKVIKMTLLAADLGYELPRSRRGWPKPAKDSHILNYLAKMSEVYGTKMKINRNRAEIELN